MKTIFNKYISHLLQTTILINWTLIRGYCYDRS